MIVLHAVIAIFIIIDWQKESGILYNSFIKNIHFNFEIAIKRLIFAV